MDLDLDLGLDLGLDLDLDLGLDLGLVWRLGLVLGSDSDSMAKSYHVKKKKTLAWLKLLYAPPFFVGVKLYTPPSPPLPFVAPAPSP